MAAQATVKRAVSDAPRASSPRVSKAKKPKEFDYTGYRKTINKVDDFVRFAQGYPDKNGLMLYVYRLEPKIDLSLIGIKDTYIEKISNTDDMTPEYVGQKYGRGVYFVKLNDANRVKGQNDICKCWFRLDDEEKPPVYDVRTLVLGHAGNIDEVNRQVAAGVLIRDPAGNPRIRTESDGNAMPPAGVTAGASGELLTKETVGQLILKLVDRGSQSPTDSIKQSIEIAKLLQPAAAQTPAFSVEQMAEMVAAKLRPATTSGTVDLFDAYERMDSFIAKVRGNPVAAVGGDGGSIWPALLPGLLTGAERLIDRFMSRLESAQSIPPRPSAPLQNGGMQQPQQKPMMERVSDVASLGFMKMNEGVAGFDFAAYVCNWHEAGRGIEIYRYLQPNGAAGLLGLAAMNPAVSPILNNPATRAQVETFLNDFFTYDPDGVAEETVEAAPAS